MNDNDRRKKNRTKIRTRCLCGFLVPRDCTVYNADNVYYTTNNMKQIETEIKPFSVCFACCYIFHFFFLYFPVVCSWIPFLCTSRNVRIYVVCISLSINKRNLCLKLNPIGRSTIPSRS